MRIDSSGRPESLTLFHVILIGLAGLAVIGLLGPAAILTVVSPAHNLTTHSAESAQSVDFTLRNLSTLSRFVRISFVLKRATTSRSIRTQIQYQYHFHFFLPNGHRDDAHSDIARTSLIEIPAHQTFSKRFVTLSNSVVHYTALDMRLDFLSGHSDFAQGRIIANHGNPKHTYFQLTVRVVSFTAALVAALFFAIKLGRTEGRHFEQKLTLPLLVLAIFYNNPFYPVQAFSPSRAYIIYDTIAGDVFNAYLRFLILALFDSLCYKNRKIVGGFFYLPNVAIGLVLFLSSVVHGIYDDMALFGLPPLSKDQVEEKVRGVQMTPFCLYIFWAMATVGLVGIGLDPTERYKFNIYAQTGLTALAALWIVHLLFDTFSQVRHTSLRFVVGFGVENGFVLLMAFFHWPCSRVRAVTLGKEDGVDEDPELFVNPEGPGPE
jgi:hypothetical protein